MTDPFNLDDMWDEAEADASPVAAILARFPQPADDTQYARLSPEQLDAREYNRNWDKARVLVLSGKSFEEVEHLLDRHPITNRAKQGMSQVVTGEPGRSVSKLVGQSDRVRQHLRTQLSAAKRRALREGNPDLVYQPWLDNVDKLYEFAGMPPNHDTPDGLVYKFTHEDTSGGFVPDNVLWLSQDAINMRLSTRRVEFEGETIPLTELAKRTGLAVGTVRARYDAGIRGERLWSGRRLNSKYDVNINGEAVSLPTLAKMCGVSVVTLRARAARGLTGLELISKDDMRSKGKRLKYNADTPEHLIRKEMQELTRQYEREQAAGNARETARIMDEILRAKRKLEDLKFRLRTIEGDDNA